MANLERLRLLESTIGKNDSLSQRLIEVYRLALEGNMFDAATKLQAAVEVSGDAQINEKSLLLIEASFVARRFDLVGILLEKKSQSACRITAQSSSEISLDYIVLIEKVAYNELVLTFSDTFSKYSNLEVQVLWLIWVLPLLTKVASSGNALPGRSFLNQWDAGMIPGLSYCAAGSGFFLIPDNNFLPSLGYREFKRLSENVTPWSKRTPIAFWRGSTTGQSKGNWRSLQRVALCQLSVANPKFIDAGLAAVVQQTIESTAEIKNSGLMRNYFPSRDLHQFRYLIDIDGNTNAWSGFFERLLSGSTVLKVESPQHYTQWYYSRLRPWHHYVPVSADMSDLVAKIEWLIRHDEEAKKIGERGRELANSIDYETELETAVDTVNAAFRSFSAMSESVANDSLKQARAKIFTPHGTFLVYDLETSKILHVVREFSLLHRRFLPLSLGEGENGGRLLTESAEHVVKINSNGSAKILAEGPEAGSVFEVIRSAEKDPLFSLKLHGLFVCAEDDGQITVSRKVASRWETLSTSPPKL
jgi:Glycosyl transferase family 90